jgi:predicted MFS family arabinose efflux permease
MLHNTLQLRASQMAPEARGSAMSAFAASFFIGQLVGIAVFGPVYDRFGGSVVVASGGLCFVVVALIYWATLPKTAART